MNKTIALGIALAAASSCKPETVTLGVKKDKDTPSAPLAPQDRPYYPVVLRGPGSAPTENRYIAQEPPPAIFEEKEYTPSAPIAPANRGRGSLKFWRRRSKTHLERKYAPEVEGSTNLHQAAYDGTVDTIMTLIAQGAQIDAKDNDGNTPLYAAAAANRKKNVKLLIKMGADAQADLYHAAKQGDATAVKALIKAGANAKDALKNAATLGDTNTVQKILQTNVKIKREDAGRTPLHCAALKGHGTTVLALINAKKSAVHAKDKHDWTPLHYAAQNGHVDVVRLLIANNAKIDAKDIQGARPLHYAALKGHVDVVRLLIANNAKIDAKDIQGARPLHYAALKGHVDVATLLIANNATVDIKDKHGNTPLYAAAAAGHKDAVKTLINAGANAQDALYHAAKKGAINVLKELINAPGAQVNAKDTKGRRLLHYAKDDASAQLLLANNATVDIKDKHGNTPLYEVLQRAARANDVTALQTFSSVGNAVEEKEGQPLWAAYAKAALELIEEKVDINKKYYEGKTLLHRAGNTAKVWALIAKGAKVNAKDNYSRTPLHWAAWNGHTAVATLLIDNKAVINAKDKWGSTPLHLAASNGHTAVATLLIDNKAVINAKDKWGSTPLHLAASNGHTAVATLLRKHGGV